MNLLKSQTVIQAGLSQTPLQLASIGRQGESPFPQKQLNSSSVPLPSKILPESMGTVQPPASKLFASQTSAFPRSIFEPRAVAPQKPAQ